MLDTATGRGKASGTRSARSGKGPFVDPVTTSTALWVPKCFGDPVTDGNFGATEGPDNIIRDPQAFGDNDNPNDVINGLGGADTLIRGEGDFGGTPEGGVDKLCGGDGNDGLIDGADKSDKSDKSDKVRGDAGDDIVDGDNFPSPFGDILRGDSGDDTLTGGQGNDNSEGGTGDDMIDVGAGTVAEGADNIKGGRGDDTINGVDDGSVDKIDCGKGQDTVTAGPEDRVAGNCENT